MRPGRATVAALSGLAACGGDPSLPEARSIEQVEALAPEHTFYSARSILPAAGGGAWVLTRDPPFLHHHRGDGSVVSFGAKGRGPDELSIPLSLLAGGAAATVWDPGNAKVVRFNPHGRAIARHTVPSNVVGFSRGSLPEISYGDPFRIRSHGAGYVAAIYPHGLLSTVDFRWGQLWLLDDRLARKRLVVDFARDLGDEPDGSRVLRVLIDVPLWDRCPDGRLLVWDPYARRLLYYSSEGEPAGETAVPVEPRPLSNQDIGRFLRHMAAHERGPSAANTAEVTRRIEQMIRSERHLFPEMAPAAVSLYCDAAGDAWLQEFGTATDGRGYGRDWLRVGRGSRIARFRFPPGVQPMAFEANRVLAIARDSMDVQRLVVVTLQRAGTEDERTADGPSTGKAR